MDLTDDTTGLAPAPWLPAWFQPPARSELTSGHHLRPLRLADVGLPGLPAGLDLMALLAAATARTSCVYGVFDDEEGCVLGVVTVGPGGVGAPAYDALVRWSVTGSPAVAGAVAAHLPGWVERTWPFASWLVDEAVEGAVGWSRDGC